MFGWLWGCLMLIEVDLGQLPFDTFADDQPTDPFALTRYNDRNESGFLGILWARVEKGKVSGEQIQFLPCIRGRNTEKRGRNSQTRPEIPLQRVEVYL